MKLITRNTDYAMRAVCYIAQNNSRAVSATEMVEALKIPRPFLRKILQTMSSEGLLVSTRGLNGGFALARPAHKIYLTELIRIFQNTIQLNECIFKKKTCPNREACMLKREIDDIEQGVLNRLSRINMASLIKNGKN